MGFLSKISDEIFGTKSKVQQSQQSLLSPQQLQMLNQLLSGAGGNPDLNDIAGGTKAFGGKLAPDLSGLEKTSLAALEQMAMNAASPEGDPTLKAARGAVEGAATEEFDEGAFDKFFGEAVAAPMLDMFKRDVLPELTRRFSGSAAFGSDRMTAERGATEDLGKALTSERAGMAFKTDQARRDRQLTAAGLAPGLVGAESDLFTNALVAGGIPRQVEGTKLAADYQEFLRQEESKSKAFERALALLGIKPHENVNTVTPGKPGFLSGAAGGIGTGLGMKLGGLMLSDRSLKRNVVKLGKHPKYPGINIYEFSFIGDKERRTGVMADEVQKVRPDAVKEIGGFLTVDYSKLQ